MTAPSLGQQQKSSKTSNGQGCTATLFESPLDVTSARAATLWLVLFYATQSVTLYSRNLDLFIWFILHFLFYFIVTAEISVTLTHPHTHTSAASKAHSSTKVSACPTNTSRTSLSSGKTSFQNKQQIEIKFALIFLLLSSSAIFQIPCLDSFTICCVSGVGFEGRDAQKGSWCL